jgi:electron transport complex protein RnfD
MDNLVVSISPHIRDEASTPKIMRDVLIALVPGVIASVVIFGPRALLVEAVCIASCLFFEWGFEKICKRPNTIGDLSAAVTGLILAFNLNVGIPLWQAIFGSFIAIVLVKQLFGGIGKNFANPAITARVVMLLAFSGTMTTWNTPTILHPSADAVTCATPLTLIAKGHLDQLPSLGQMFLGIEGGCLGETCTLALLIGGIYLLVRKIITWHTPVAFIGTVFVLSLIFGQDPLVQILSGGVFLGAIFMATDYATTPSTNKGRIIFGIGCGVITVLIRIWGNYPEGVSFSILLMNLLTPFIIKWTRNKPLGGVE